MMSSGRAVGCFGTLGVTVALVLACGSCVSTGVSGGYDGTQPDTSVVLKDSAQADSGLDSTRALDIPGDQGGSDTPEDGGAGDLGLDAGPEPGEFLYPCEENVDCYSGYCVEAPEGKVCTKNCLDSCPDGWACSMVGGSGDPVFICVPNDTYLCRPCDSDLDCNTPGLPQTGVCRMFGTYGSLCTRKCSEAVGCPENFYCEEVQLVEDGPVLNLCNTEGGLACSCTPKFVDEAASTTCKISNEHGTCEGEIICLEVGPLPACNASIPQPEVCNGVDDDCDGEIDEGDAEGCTMFYLDMDGDGYGLGYGECHCNEPPQQAGGKWLKEGGDCNELIASVNPGVVETCNGMDDDCDGEIDEENAVGCKKHFVDADLDGYGGADVKSCRCEGVPGWTMVPGDCDDGDDTVHPNGIEVCDTLDNNCNDEIDEENAADCQPYFKDIDGDGFGLTDKMKCLCQPFADYTAPLPNDCDESSSFVNPTAPEICNGIDDNCNNEVDEGTEALCPIAPNGETVCNGVDGCGLASCHEGWSDADGDFVNGCECGAGNLELPDMPGYMCQQPHFLATLVDVGEETQFSDNVVSNDPNAPPDEDWYSFTAVDGPDTDGCDTFAVNVEFLHNPDNQFVFDVYRSSCAGADNVCSGVTHFTDASNFFDDTGASPLGECPCVVGETDEATAPGVQLCSDQTTTYYVRVYRKPNLQVTCEAYTLRVRNGI